MGKYNGVLPNKRIYINKSHREVKCSNGTTMHSMIFSDSHRDQTGTYITDGTYSIRWWSNDAYFDKEKVTIGEIQRVELEKYQDRSGAVREVLMITVTIIKEGQPNQNIYGGNGSNYNTPYQSEPQYANYNDGEYGDY